MMDGVSVIICCYNSGKVISETLKHLSRQKVINGLSWEVILVDNNCFDNTVELAVQLWSALGEPTNLRILKEPKPGLSYARWKGINEASFGTLIFCDDDNWLSNNYVQDAYDILRANPKIGACGGNGNAYIEGNEPAWFDSFKTSFACGIQSSSLGQIVSESSCLFGAGLIIRKYILLRLQVLGFKSLLIDRKGDSLSSGGDSELTYLVSLLGYELWASPNLKYTHFIDKSRLTRDYLYRLNKGLGASIPNLQLYRLAKEDYSSEFRQSWLYEFMRSFLVFVRSIVMPPVMGERKVFFNRFSASLRVMWKERKYWKKNLSNIKDLRDRFVNYNDLA